MVSNGKPAGSQDQVHWNPPGNGTDVYKFSLEKGMTKLPSKYYGTGQNALSLDEKMKLRKCIKGQSNRTKHAYSKLTQEKVAVNLLKIKTGFRAPSNENEDAKEVTVVEGEPSTSGCKRTTLPKAARNKLKNWLFSHLANPYPNEEEKKELQEETNLTSNPG